MCVYIIYIKSLLSYYISNKPCHFILLNYIIIISYPQASPQLYNNHKSSTSIIGTKSSPSQYSISPICRHTLEDP